jgi:hypothetical protein
VRDFLHFICTKLHEPLARLGVAQAPKSALQAGQRVGDREAVNLHLGLSCRFARAAAQIGQASFLGEKLEHMPKEIPAFARNRVLNRLFTQWAVLWQAQFALSHAKKREAFGQIQPGEVKPTY